MKKKMTDEEWYVNEVMDNGYYYEYFGTAKGEGHSPVKEEDEKT